MNAERMIEALARHERAMQHLAEIKDQIGNSLRQCPIEIQVQGLWQSIVETGHLFDEKGRTKTHLWHALNGRGDGDVIEYLADDETGCPHCAKAFALILQRKDARQELGVARRLIRHYGKLALAVGGAQ
jgi:hypothetical protein